MKTRIEYCRTGTGYHWFLDALVDGDWQNVSCYEHQYEAILEADKLAGIQAVPTPPAQHTAPH